MFTSQNSEFNADQQTLLNAVYKELIHLLTYADNPSSAAADALNNAFYEGITETDLRSKLLMQ